MIPRVLERRLRELLAGFPAVALVGARQTGKTTLARSLGGVYFDLEQDQDRLRLDLLWEELARGGELVVLDEIQTAPEVLRRLRGTIDSERERNGRFLLLGSVAPSLVRDAAEALTGRLGLCELSPLLASEVGRERWDDLWRLGGYPGFGATAGERYRDGAAFYLDLMAQRDLPQWGLPARPLATARLLKMIAARHGQLWNASEIGRSLGISFHTVNAHAELLEQAFLVRRLPAYSANVGKRLTKSPKVYFRDSGLLHTLLGWSPDRDLLDQPWVGASWEGWIISQVLDALAAAGRRAEASFLRTHDQREIDLLLELDGQRLAVEVKLTSQPSVEMLRALAGAADLARADRAVLVSRTSRPTSSGTLVSTNLEGLLRELGCLG